MTASAGIFVAVSLAMAEIEESLVSAIDEESVFGVTEETGVNAEADPVVFVRIPAGLSE